MAGRRKERRRGGRWRGRGGRGERDSIAKYMGHSRGHR